MERHDVLIPAVKMITHEARPPMKIRRLLVPALVALLSSGLPANPPGEAALRAAAQYSEEIGGTAVLVVHQGEVIFEQYAAPFGPQTPFSLHSGTKAFWAAAIAAMVDEGLISDFDEPARETLPEWSGVPYKNDITIRHLLQLNGLHTQDIQRLQGCPPNDPPDDLYLHAINTRARIQPGEVFSYGPVNYYALGEIMRRKLQPLGIDPLEYLDTRIFQRLGIRYASWCRDNSGNPNIPNGSMLTSRDWARFGEFMLRDGNWEGEQIIPAPLMISLREPSIPNVGHGLALWVNTPGGAAYIGQQIIIDSNPGDPGGFIYNGGEPDMFAAMGAGPNRMYMIPGRDLVVVRNTFQDTGTFVDTEFLELLLEEGQAPGQDSCLWLIH
jgi:CubicO group peptidase (beta-lactamase class C family)